jgi:hypothetical protein
VREAYKMRNKAIIAVLIITILFFTSCTNKNEREGQRVSEKEYRTGTHGLQLTFLRNAPPDNFYAGNEMDIIVEVRNIGAYPETDSFDGKLEVYGYDEKAFIGERWDGGNFISTTLQGRSQYSPRGGIERRKFHVDRVETPFGTEFYEPKIAVAACYKYRTLAMPSVCIDPDPYTIFDSPKVCTLSQGAKTYGLSSQGAPVAVTKVVEEVSKNNIHFRIYIKNVGGGQVVDENVRTDCPFNLDYNDRDKVLVTAKLPFDSSPVCQPSGTYRDPVRLDEKTGEGFIFCTFQKPPQETAFESVLQVQLDYRYIDTIEKKVRITNIDR